MWALKTVQIIFLIQVPLWHRRTRTFQCQVSLTWIKSPKPMDRKHKRRHRVLLRNSNVTFPFCVRDVKLRHSSAPSLTEHESIIGAFESDKTGALRGLAYTTTPPVVCCSVWLMLIPSGALTSCRSVNSAAAQTDKDTVHCLCRFTVWI